MGEGKERASPVRDRMGKRRSVSHGWEWERAKRSAGQLENPLADDVALDLVAAAGDGAAACGDRPLQPFAAGNRKRVAVLDLRVGPQQFHREHLDAQIQFRAAELEGGAFRTRRLALEAARDAAKGVVLDCLGL